MRWLELKLPPPVVAAVLAAAMWSCAALGHPLLIPLKALVAAVLLAAGVAFDLLGLLAFRASRTTIDPLRPQRASVLVTGGIYRLTRNPMYVGLALMLTAWASYLAAPVPFAGPLLFVLYITRFQIAPEERVLREAFGAEYASYTTRVRRWM